MPQNWIVDGILAQKWAFQKGLMFVVTIFSLGLASLISVTTFEKKKKQLFETDAERRAEMKRIAEAKNKLDGKQPQRAAPKTAAPAPAKGAAPVPAKGPAKK
jgi:hypothetical protein